jgi:FMN-dependent NADH-azoreductase
MNILQINSSARRSQDGQGSVSTLLANELSAALQARDAATLTVRDLTTAPHPALDEATLGALFTPAAARSPEQAARVALDDTAIAELQAADVLVLGVPMYNFSVTTQLKNWIDAVARAGVTFRYTEKGPQGLLTGKKVYAVLSRGGVHRGQASDTIVPYLRNVLGFLGMSDVEFIYAEGLNLGPDAAAQGLAQARAQIEQLLGAAQTV